MFRKTWQLLPLALLVGCAERPKQENRALLPTPEARSLLDTALARWRDQPDRRATTAAARNAGPLFVDNQRKPGQKLLSYSVLRSSISNRVRTFQVKLELDQPGQSVLAEYHVFGRIPNAFVFRAEDYAMFIHWECVMPTGEDEPSAPETEKSKATADLHQSHAHVVD